MSPQAALNDFLSVKRFGAKGDNSTDDTSAINAALVAAVAANSCVWLPAGFYKVTTLTFPTGACIRGQSVWLNGSVGSAIVGTSGDDTITALNIGTVEADDWIIENLYVVGGLNAIHIGTGNSWVTAHIYNSVLQGTANGILVDQAVERGSFVNSQFIGGTGCGFSLANTGNTSNNYMDKTVFLNDRFEQGVGGFCSDTSRVSNSNTFINPVFNAEKTYGMKILGSTQQWSIIAPVFEVIGNVSSSHPTPTASAFTTGTTSGTNQTALTVASNSTLANGQTLTIQGGSNDGSDFQTVISNVSGTAITVSPAIPKQLTGNEVTNSVGQYILLGNPSLNSGNTNAMTITSGQLAEGTGDNILYAMNVDACTGCTFISTYATDRPIYDPYGGAINLSSYGFRTTSNLSAVPWQYTNFKAVDYTSSLPSMFPGNPGIGISFPCLGSGGPGSYNTGTYGNITMGPHVSNGVTADLTVNCDTGAVTAKNVAFSDSTTTIAAGTGAGTSPTVSITGGHTNSGLINITTGSGSPATAATLATISFATTLAAAPSACMIDPANNATQALAVGADPFVSSTSTTTFVLTTGGTALATATAYKWWYHCF